MKPSEAVHEFHTKFGIKKATLKSKKSMEFRMRLIHEEFNEVIDAAGFAVIQANGNALFIPKIKECDPEHLLKELADLAYVIYGTAEALGWDLDEAVKRIHASNMSKLDENGKPIYRDDGKVLKSNLYKEPYLGDLV